jgi:hypothetical protein
MRNTSWGRILVGVLLFAGGVGCGDSASNTDGEPPPPVLTKVSGDSQAVAPTAASAPMVIRLLDSLGDTLVGQVVTFAVTAGTGTVTLSDTTDAEGLASAIFTAPASAGARKVRARVTGATDLFFDLLVGAGAPVVIMAFEGAQQGTDVSTAYPFQLGAKVTDGWGNPIAGAKVAWGIVSGGGSVASDTTLTNAAGIARVARTAGAAVGGQVARAVTAGVADTAFFHGTGKKGVTVLAGGNNVPQCSSDLWVQGDYAYTGTWGNCFGQNARRLHIWNVSSGVVLDTTITVGVSPQGTVSDNEVTEDGSLMLATFEGGGAANGLYLYSLANPARPALESYEPVSTGLHTGTFGTVAGKQYIFASKNPGSPAVITYRVEPDSADKLVPVDTIPIPADYGTHDQFFRDGFLFVSAWNTGLMIYDVGAGTWGGTPASPALVSVISTANMGLSCNCVHNAWWYHDATGGKRYVFVGQEGPGSVGTSSSGSIHVVDVSSLAAPTEVATFTLGAVGGQATGVHNFWMDEARGILYAAYYNGGVVALDVTGTLSGNLAAREIFRIQPGGAATYVWGVMLANGALWASDMESGFWKLSVP